MSRDLEKNVAQIIEAIEALTRQVTRVAWALESRIPLAHSDNNKRCPACHSTLVLSEAVRCPACLEYCGG